MILLHKTLAQWGAHGFGRALKTELEALPAAALPLQQGLRHGSVALEDEVEAMLLGAEELEDRIRVRVMIFYKSVIAGCACEDDPTPTDTCDEQCMVQIDIDKQTAEATITLVE